MGGQKRGVQDEVGEVNRDQTVGGLRILYKKYGFYSKCFKKILEILCKKQG